MLAERSRGVGTSQATGERERRSRCGDRGGKRDPGPEDPEQPARGDDQGHRREEQQHERVDDSEPGEGAPRARPVCLARTHRDPVQHRQRMDQNADREEQRERCQCAQRDPPASRQAPSPSSSGGEAGPGAGAFAKSGSSASCAWVSARALARSASSSWRSLSSIWSSA